MSSTTPSTETFAQRINNLATAYDSSPTNSIDEQISSHSTKYLISTEDAARLVCNNVLDDLPHESESVDAGDILSPTITPIDELSTDGSWPTVVATVTGSIPSTHESIAQKVRVSDGTGETYVTQFANTNHPQLEEGQTYVFYNAMPNEYQGEMSLVLNEPSLVAHAVTDIQPANSYTGIVTDLLAGSGLIKRCPVDDCSRVVTDSTCAVHGSVDGDYDLRLKTVLDTGTEAHQVTIGRQLTEKLTQFTLEAAIETAEEAMDTDVVAREMKHMLHGQYLTVSGPVVYESIQANSAALATSRTEIGISPDDIPQVLTEGTRGDSK